MEITFSPKNLLKVLFFITLVPLSAFGSVPSSESEGLNKQYVEEQLKIFQKKLEKESWRLTASIDYDKRTLKLTSSRSAQKNATLPLLTTYSIDDMFNDKTRRSGSYWSFTLITPYDRMIEFESSPYGRYGKRYTLYYSHKRKWENMLDDTGITNLFNICNEFIRAYPEEANKIIAQEEDAIVENTERDKRLEEKKAAEVAHFGEQIERLAELIKKDEEVELIAHGKNSKFVFANEYTDGFNWTVETENDAILVVFHMKNNTNPKFKVTCETKDESGTDKNKLSGDSGENLTEFMNALKGAIDFNEVSASYTGIRFSDATCGPYFDIDMCSSRNAEPGELAFVLFRFIE